MVQALGLTVDQKERIRAIQNDFRNAALRAAMSERSSTQPGNEADFDNHDARNKALALLTPKQLEMWKSLVGKPFSGLVIPLGLPGAKRPATAGR
jgi:hypothetical protein